MKIDNYSHVVLEISANIRELYIKKQIAQFIFFTRFKKSRINSMAKY